MPWNAAFPQPNDLVSQAPTPFQNNWAFLATNIGTDHYFNSGGATEGHHRFSQYVDQAGDPALAAGCSGVVYVKPNTTGGTQQLFYRNASNVRQIPLYHSPGVYTFGAPGNNIPVFDFAGTLNPCIGLFLTYRVGQASQSSALFFWDGATLNVTELSKSGSVTAIGSSGTNLTMSSSSGPVSYQLNFITLYP